MLSSIILLTRPLKQQAKFQQKKEIEVKYIERDRCGDDKQILSWKLNNYIMQQNKDGLIKSLKPQELKQIILQNQNKLEKGYYTKQQWGELHENLLGVERTMLPVLNTWRLLKLINFGDDYVPTGLVYDTLITLLDQEKTIQETEALIKSIFFKFIQFNGKFLSRKQRQELAFFKVIKSVVQGYRQILTGNIQPIQAYMKDRNQQLYRLHNVFTYRKNLETLKKIEDQFKNCKFEPEITPKSQLTQSRYMEPKINHQEKYEFERLQQNEIIDEEEEFYDNFRASPVPEYPEVVPMGLNEHLVRMQKSREIKRMSSLKPYKGNNSNAQIAPFSLEERNSARKERQVNNFKLLFFVKVEVGKRLFRVKVREHMTIEDVVRNIELMVGFKDESLYDIVKSYFVNYQNKLNHKDLIYEQY